MGEVLEAVALLLSVSGPMLTKESLTCSANPLDYQKFYP